MTHSQQFFKEVSEIAQGIDFQSVERIVEGLVRLRERGGRLFLLGVGGSAANCSHAVNDFRKLAGIEAYAPTDNVAELTARTNDEGWETVFEAWLRTSRAGEKDAVLVLSVAAAMRKKRSASILSARLRKPGAESLRFTALWARGEVIRRKSETKS